MLTNLVKNAIANIVKFANEFEDEFVKIVVDEDYKKIHATQRKNFREFIRGKILKIIWLIKIYAVNVYAGCNVYEYKSNDVILNVLPFHHLFGLTYVLIASFLILVPEMTKFLLLRIKKFGLIEAVGRRLNEILCGGPN